MKNEGDKLIVIFKTSEKIDSKNLRSILQRKLFTKNKISQKLNDIFEFYKNRFVVFTQSFHIKAKVSFSKISY